MLLRTLEPEVMDTADEVRDYDAMDHRDVNRRFVDDFLAVLAAGSLASRLFGTGEPLEILDVGTGTAQIPIELCGRDVNCHVTGVDLAAEMLKLAVINVRRAGLDQSIRVEQVDAKGLPYPDGRFDAVMSNSIVHHIPEPRPVVAEMVRVLRPGGCLFLRDLLRPPDPAAVERLVTAYAGNGNAHQQQLFRQSLHAALTLDEMRGLLGDLHLPAEWANQTSDRHWTIATSGERGA